MGILVIGIAHAQIGINTDIPFAGSIFHVDSKGNNATTLANKYDDDIIMLSNGNVGVGTTSPSAKLHIKGKLKINTPNLKPESVFLSDNLGVGDWSYFKANKIAIWDLTGPTKTFANNTEVLLNGTSTFSKNDFGEATSSDSEILNGGLVGSAVVIPKGRYLIYPMCDLTGNEYGILKIYKVGSTTPIFYSEYGVLTSGISLPIEFSVKTTLYMTFTAIISNSNLYLAPGYNASYKTQMIIHNIP